MVVSDDERYFIVGFNGSVRKAYQHDTPKVTYLPTHDSLVGEVVHFQYRGSLRFSGSLIR